MIDLNIVDEEFNVSESIGSLDLSNILKIAYSDQNIVLFKYIDQYGETVFNKIQMDDLIKDCEYLLAKDNSSKEVLINIIFSCNKVKGETHIYLNFSGD